MQPRTHLLADRVPQAQPVGVRGAEVIEKNHEHVKVRVPRAIFVPLQGTGLEGYTLAFELFGDGAPSAPIRLIPQTSECGWDREDIGSRHGSVQDGRDTTIRPFWTQHRTQETSRAAGYDTGMQPIGPWLRTMREKRGVSATKVAQHLGLNTATFAKYELGNRKVPYDLLEPWGNALGFRVELVARSLEDPPVAADLTDAQRALLDQVLTSAGALGDADADLIRAMVHRIAAKGGGPT